MSRKELAVTILVSLACACAFGILQAQEAASESPDPVTELHEHMQRTYLNVPMTLTISDMERLTAFKETKRSPSGVRYTYEAPTGRMMHLTFTTSDGKLHTKELEF